jgi:hypothetical protein
MLVPIPPQDSTHRTCGSRRAPTSSGDRCPLLRWKRRGQSMPKKGVPYQALQYCQMTYDRILHNKEAAQKDPALLLTCIVNARGEEVPFTTECRLCGAPEFENFCRPPIQLPPLGRNDCGPGGRRGTIPYHTKIRTCTQLCNPPEASCLLSPAALKWCTRPSRVRGINP